MRYLQEEKDDLRQKLNEMVGDQLDAETIDEIIELFDQYPEMDEDGISLNDFADCKQ